MIAQAPDFNQVLALALQGEPQAQAAIIGTLPQGQSMARSQIPMPPPKPAFAPIENSNTATIMNEDIQPYVNAYQLAMKALQPRKSK